MKPQTTACCSAALFQSPCGKDLGCASLTLRSLPVAPVPSARAVFGTQRCPTVRTWRQHLPPAVDVASLLLEASK